VAGCGAPPSEEVAVTSAAVTGISVSGGVHAYTRSDGVHAILYQGVDNHIKEYAENPFGGGTVTDLGGGGNVCVPWGYARTDGMNAVIYVDINLHLHEIGLISTGWVDNDFRTISWINAPLVNTNEQFCQARAYIRSDGVNCIVYRGTDNHIYEISSNFSGFPSWIVTDLSATTGATNAWGGNPYPYVRSDHRSAIVYTANDKHIHELLGPAPWVHNDLFTLSGETVGAQTEPWAYNRAISTISFSSVLYVGNVNPMQIHELYTSGQPLFCGATTWCHTTLPATSPSTSVTAYVRRDGINSVVYRSSIDTLVHELRRPAATGGFWFDTVMPFQGGASFGAWKPFGHQAPGDRSSVVYIRSGNPDWSIEQVSLPTGGSWQLEQL
jgi:hypothetical protein